MESERIDGMVSALRARGIMAHRADEGVYEYGIRVVIPDGSQALWTVGGAAGLDAEVLRDGSLIGYVPHVPGSETFTDEQTVEAIAAARYSEEGLHPAGPPPARPGSAPAPPEPRPPVSGRPEPPAGTPGGTRRGPSRSRWFRWAHR